MQPKPKPAPASQPPVRLKPSKPSPRRARNPLPLLGKAAEHVTEQPAEPITSAPRANENRIELRAEHLQKRYRARQVVKDVSLEVRSGEVIGLLGPNGAGKTTCFYMMVGLVAMDAGELYLDGERITHMPIHRRARLGLSYLPQGLEFRGCRSRHLLAGRSCT